MTEFKFSPLSLSHYTATTCVGQGSNALWQALQEARSGLKPCDFDDAQIDCWIGEVAGLDQVRIPEMLKDFDCRNNRLALLSLEADGFFGAAQAAIKHYGKTRVGVFLGTSTSGVLQAELAYRRRDANGAIAADFNYGGSHSNYSLARFVREVLGLRGPAHVISSACSSSARVFVSAEHMIRMGWIDAAIVGGVDSLCLTTLYGFHSLELTSSQACRPYDANRDGLSVGEAGAFVLLERADANLPDAYLLGYGETSDAHHMSTPHPEGLGAKLAMEAALDMAHLQPQQIDYLNLHGTATQNNDSAEGCAVQAVFGAQTACSSTKGTTGHTLGAAGGVEAVICALALKHQSKPIGINTQQLDPALTLNYLLQPQAGEVKYVQSNSFGFGGTNCSLIFGHNFASATSGARP